MKKWIKFKNVDNTDIALFIAAGAIIMLGLSYISVPLYQLFCQTYGIGGTVQKINYEQSIQNKIETLYTNQNVQKGPHGVPSEKDTQNIQTSELNINSVNNKIFVILSKIDWLFLFLKFFFVTALLSKVLDLLPSVMYLFKVNLLKRALSQVSSFAADLQLSSVPDSACAIQFLYLKEVEFNNIIIFFSLRLRYFFWFKR